MAKYLKFITTIYNNTITDEKELRSVFDSGESYKVISENDDFYILEFPNHSYYNNKGLFGIEKGLDEYRYEVIEYDEE